MEMLLAWFWRLTNKSWSFAEFAFHVEVDVTLNVAVVISVGLTDLVPRWVFGAARAALDLQSFFAQLKRVAFFSLNSRNLLLNTSWSCRPSWAAAALSAPARSKFADPASKATNKNTYKKINNVRNKILIVKYCKALLGVYRFQALKTSRTAWQLILPYQ